MTVFSGDARAVLIGSLPHDNHREAVRLIFEYTPEIPLWPQLPNLKEEGMLLQFLHGMPGVVRLDEKIYVDTEADQFETEFLAFFEEYLLVTEGEKELGRSRFAMSSREAGGLFAFCDIAADESERIVAAKGQLTGPITFCTGVVDQHGRALYYNEQLRDAAIKLLAMKAKWQARKLAEIKSRPLVFFDEPSLAGFGSSAFITITREDIGTCFQEVFTAVQEEEGLAGVHVCANTEWSILFATGVDIVSFDAYSYFDKLILYPKDIASFFERGGILASGIVPTSTELVEREDAASLTNKWISQAEQLEKLGISKETIFAQTLITPSCGTGTVSEATAVKVMELTRDVSERIRRDYL